ncbi:MAG: hypothetical protein RIK87_26330 [Fuerstiella sp.]
MYKYALAVSTMVFGVTTTGDADQVTFQNLTSGPVLVRCISGGTQVSPLQEYRQTIAAGDSHSRPDFASGNRAAVAWNADRSHCAAIPFKVRDGMTLVIKQQPDGGEIFFEAPCASCSGGGSVSSEPTGGADLQVARLASHQFDRLSVTLFVDP